MLKVEKQKGFTIVELLIVIVVIAILAAITIVAYNGIRDRANTSALSSELQQAMKVLESSYTLNSETYPINMAAAQSAGLKAGAGTTMNYYSNGAFYCLQGEKSGAKYFITSQVKVPRDGICTADGTVMWLPLSESAGDLTNTSNAITVSGATLTNGQNNIANGAYSFSASTHKITSSALYPTTTTQPFTVSLWTKGTASSSSEWAYLARYGTVTDVGNSVWLIGMQPGNQYTFSVNGEWSSGGTAVVANANDWVHLVLTYDGSVYRGFVNGALRASATVGAITKSMSSPSLILGTVVSNRVLNGSIDDFRIFNRALSNDDITKLYSAGAL